MKMNTVYLGIDVSKKALHLATPDKFVKEFSNNSRGIQSLVTRILKFQPILVVMESSGGYERAACDAMQDAGIQVCIAQATCVRYFAKSIKVLAKTDTIDAQVIARFGASTKPQPTPKTPENVRKLRALHDRRQQLVEDRVRESNRLEMCADLEVAEQIQQNIELIKQREKELEQAIEDLRQNDSELKRKAEVMMQQKGIGTQTANTLLALLPELGDLDRQQIAALAGVAPHANESGNWTGKRRIYGGRAQIRKAMYMAARTAARWCPVISQFYQRLRENGKSFKLAIIACARKMIIRVNTLIKKLKNQTTSEPQTT
jgi:transposase